MGTLKNSVTKKIKASSLTEVIVATTILMLVFSIALLTLNNIMTASIGNNTQKIEVAIQKLIYQYQSRQLKIPIKIIEGDWTLSVQKHTHNQIDFIEFEATHANAKKAMLKKRLAYEN